MRNYNSTVVIPVLQSTEILSLFLDSFWKTVCEGTQVIFVNDGSGQGVQGMLERCKAHTPRGLDLNLISHERSLGTAISINQALRIATGDIICLLDSDVILCEGWQTAMLSTFEVRPQTGAAGATLLYPQSGGVQHCGLVFSEDIARHLFLNSLPDVVPSEVYTVQAVVFALCAMPRHVMESAGKLDERFFNGYEDLDYQMRIRQLGYEIVVQPKARAYHWERSNGVHRIVNRKRNLGRFWRLWGDYIRPDLWRFTEENLRRQIQVHPGAQPQRYLGVDLCEDRVDAEYLWQNLRSIEYINVEEVIDYSFRLENTDEIWLPQILGTGSHSSQFSYLFLVRNFVLLLGNRYWIELRDSTSNDDVVIDLYGNVIYLRNLKGSCWPGTKIR